MSDTFLVEYFPGSCYVSTLAYTYSHRGDPSAVGVKLEIEASSQLARSTVDGLTPRELTQQPGPQSWSVAECLAHLNLTSKAYLPLVTMAIENALLDARYGSAPTGWTGRDIPLVDLRASRPLQVQNHRPVQARQRGACQPGPSGIPLSARPSPRLPLSCQRPGFESDQSHFAFQQSHSIQPLLMFSAAARAPTATSMQAAQLERR